MKFFRYILVFSIFAIATNSCKKEPENQWQVEIKNPARKIKIVDISKEYYDQNLPLENFKQQFPWFQGSVSDVDFNKRRKDTAEIKIYQAAMNKIDLNKLTADLADLFSHVKHYFPEFKEPTVFLYSSALQGITDAPVFYKKDTNMVFIDVSAFLGDGNPYYKGLELYFQKSMNPSNIVPKVSQVLAENWVPMEANHHKFIDLIIYNGKIEILQDAFLPNTPDYLKMNYTQKQYDWCVENESNIWNYFVEKNILFSDDQDLGSRFVSPAPFSKFYAEIDNQSSPQVGIFIGWRICRSFFEKKPATPLKDFLKMDATEIFKESEYKPKNIETN